AAAVDRVQKRGTTLDLLLFNAGTNAKGDSRAYGIGGLERSAFRGIVETNAVSQVIAAQAFLPLLRMSAQDTVGQPDGPSPAIVFISSQMGSIEIAMSPQVNAYSVSKAALNMVAVGLARELRDQGITVLTMHPGHVATDMGGASAPVKPEDSAKGIADVIASATPEQSGSFLDWQGKRLPW
ncbi:MAG: SDR family NAD(P)-dependent oxidoreductase, partial [Spirochaetaceae bacterium]